MKKNRFKNIVVVISILFFNGLFAQHDTTKGFDFIVTNDGVWTWFNDERAAFKNDKLYTSYVKKDGTTGLSVNNIKTGATIGTETILSTWTQKDDHNNAAILLREDGKIMTFFSPHIREKKNYYRTSLVDEPTQQSDWSEQIAQTTTNDSDNKGATYNNAFQLSAEGNKIYNFMRTNNFNPNWKEYDASGTPLRNGTDIILFKNGNGDTRPYVKYTSNSTDRIDFFFTDGHPRVADNSLYHCYYKTNNDGTQGKIYQSNGTEIATLQSVIDGVPIQVALVNKIYVFGSDGTSARAWTHSINYDSSGNPVVTYSKQLNINEITYHYAKWTGTEWNNNLVSDAGKGLYAGEDDYTGIITTNPYNTNEIFVSTNKNPITEFEDNRYEIYSAITADGGATWSWTEVTKDSDQDNLRPFVPKGISNVDDRVVLWFHGDYVSYSNYSTRIVGEYMNKVYSGEAPDLGEVAEPINTNFNYGIDINTASSPTLNPFTSIIGATDASVIDNGVTFTVIGANIAVKDRGDGTPNDVVRDFAYVSPEVSGGNIGVRIEDLPEGTYTINSYHFDTSFPADVTVRLQEQGGPVLQTIEIENTDTPASFQLFAQSGKVYEVIATENNSDNRVRFNGLSIDKLTKEFLLDVNTAAGNTKNGYTGILGSQNKTVTIDEVDYMLFGFGKSPRTNENSDPLLSDLAVNSATNSSAQPAIGLRITGLAAGTYQVKSWHYDPTVNSSSIKIQVREAGAGNPLTNLVTGVSLGSADASEYEIVIEANKNYDLVFRADNNGLESRFNGIEIKPKSGNLSTISIKSNENDFVVYPNPFNDELFIKNGESTPITMVVLCNLMGAVVLEQKITTSNVIKVKSSVSPGTYILKAFGRQGLLFTKIVVRK
ncbi:BNR-4 repeat-containing protein [Flavicella sediminum]|uniref:BNR-4 repeat-containing protein n=1 Tax=Flavicella sediminum TaxID=2585141 RepID=UPI00111D3B67|nr:BNR-4 repeat-containing protein [Flavicella sediminum]